MRVPSAAVIRAKLHSLTQDEQMSKAAAWAYFTGDEEKAVKILMSSESIILPRSLADKILVLLRLRRSLSNILFCQTPSCSSLYHRQAPGPASSPQRSSASSPNPDQLALLKSLTPTGRP